MLHQPLAEIGFGITMSAKLWYDNQATLQITSNSICQERTNILKYSFVRKYKVTVAREVMIEEQLEDTLTKGHRARINYLNDKLDMVERYG